MPEHSGKIEQQSNMNYSELWNDQLNPSSFEEDDEYYELLIEQYKTYVDTTEMTSQRRIQTNIFYISLNTAILAAVSYIFSESNSIAALLFAGGAVIAAMFLSHNWWQLVNSYPAINTAKFKVIGQMEQRLLCSPFWNAEWRELKERTDSGVSYRSLAGLESTIPKVILAMYAFVLFVGVGTYFKPELLKTSPVHSKLDPVTISIKSEDKLKGIVMPEVNPQEKSKNKIAE